MSTLSACALWQRATTYLCEQALCKALSCDLAPARIKGDRDERRRI